MKEEGIFSKDYRQVVQKIRDLRIEKNLTQHALAERLKRTQSYISKIESGQIRIDVIQMQEIARALGKDVNYFLG